MIEFSPVWGVALRHLRMWRRDFNYILGGFYWPVLDILIWGFLGTWISQSNAVAFENYEIAALLGILLWQFVGRGCIFIITTFSEELWSNNIVNLFSLPLKLGHWICGSIVFYAIMMVLTSAFCMLVMFTLYDVPFWYTLSTFLIFSPPLFLCGIWLGFTCLQIITTLGKRGVELGFVVGWFFLPFSGAYYPVEVLPHWGQIISMFLPMRYIFHGMRRYLMFHEDPTLYLLKGYGLSIVYVICATLLFVYCFNRSREKGIARLAD